MRVIAEKETRGPAANTIAQLKTSTTAVRMAVARLESIPATPIFARIAVSPAKKAESSAQNIQLVYTTFYVPALIIADVELVTVHLIDADEITVFTESTDM